MSGDVVLQWCWENLTRTWAKSFQVGSVHNQPAPHVIAGFFPLACHLLTSPEQQVPAASSCGPGMCKWHVQVNSIKNLFGFIPTVVGEYLKFDDAVAVVSDATGKKLTYVAIPDEQVPFNSRLWRSQAVCRPAALSQS